VSGDQDSAHHELMGGELHVYKRENSKYWQCATFLKGYNHRATTKQVSLAQAKDVAKDWYRKQTKRTPLRYLSRTMHEPCLRIFSSTTRPAR